MKFSFIPIIISFIILSCNNAAKPADDPFVFQKDSVHNFFPVTAYIKGEIFNIKQNGINPIKYVTINEHTDSSWVKTEELDAAVQEFLKSEIDSTNLNTLFSEKSFLDRSLNAVTLTYDPIGLLPDSMHLRHWDVYINPTTNKIKRIYLVKEMDKNKTLQLTWVNGQWCKITTLITDEKGNSKIEREEKLFWDF